MKAEPVCFCFRCGSTCCKEIIDGYSRHVCSECHTIYYEQWKVSAGARVVQGGQLLLVQRRFDPWAGCWHMPAGYVEKGEDPKIAAERETQEETGLSIRASRIVDIYPDNQDPRGDVLVIIYDGEILGGRLMKKSETMDVRFFYPKDIIDLPLAGPSATKSIGDWLRGQNGN